MKTRTLELIATLCTWVACIGFINYLIAQESSETRRGMRLYLSNEIASSDIALKRVPRYSGEEAKAQLVAEEKKQLAASNQCLSELNKAEAPNWQDTAALSAFLLGSLGARIFRERAKKQKLSSGN